VGDSVELVSDTAAGNDWLLNGVSTGAAGISYFTSISGNYQVLATNASGCEDTSDVITVTVNPLPTVTFTPLANVCDTIAAFALTGGLPTGGTYSGTGVSAGNFDPAAAGVGTHTITYDFADINGCTNSATQTITVDSCVAVGVSKLLDAANSINLYPNPTNGILHIDAAAHVKVSAIRVYDITGSLVIEHSNLPHFIRGAGGL